jgi:hypothetical protein
MCRRTFQCCLWMSSWAPYDSSVKLNHTTRITSRTKDTRHLFLFEGLFKIFWTDPVKTIKITIRPIGRHHPRSSYLPHVDTGPTVSSIFLFSFSVRMSNTYCDSAWISSMVSNRRLFSLNFIFGNTKMSQGVKSGEYGGWGITANLRFARNCWMRVEV